jgi:hypothetical protein
VEIATQQVCNTGEKGLIGQFAYSSSEATYRIVQLVLGRDGPAGSRERWSSRFSGEILYRISALLLSVVFCLNVAAQSKPAELKDFVGVYEYKERTKIDIIAGKDLFAVVDEAKYRLPEWCATTCHLSP